MKHNRSRYLLTKNCLRKAGISNEIVWLEDGRSGLEFFFSDTFGKTREKHIVLLDIRLPKVEGTRILEILKSDEKFEGIPVIMLTTSEDHQLARQCYELGCDAHVVKPPDEALLKAIQRFKARF